jgi:alpha-tubulin suppressor-like RCC1 family protein
MRRLLVGLLPVALVLAACQTGRTMWAGCDESGDRTGTDGTYVLFCRNGRWEPIMTNAEYVALARGEKVTIAPAPQPPLGETPSTTYTSVEAGDQHTCAVTTSGGAKCWGNGDLGKLGNGSTVNKSSPTDVTGLTSGVKAISSGQGHSCAVTTVGGVKCWGSNSSGELGDGTTTQRNTPVDVTGLTSGVTAVRAGIDFTCALLGAGTVKCWGKNMFGQLGDGTTTSSTTPVSVVGLSNVRFVSSNGSHSCALVGSAVKCWGDNSSLALGDSQVPLFSSVPVSASVSGSSAIGSGVLHVCAVSGGGAECWGENGNAELGNGTLTSTARAGTVSGLGSGVVAVTGGGYHSCAVTSGGAAKCWGWAYYGQLGNGVTNHGNSTTPVNVSGLGSGVTAISAGGTHTCALVTGGAAKCWGDRGFGKLGNGSQSSSTSPVNVVG